MIPETIFFESFPKLPRLFKDATATEKIDGTNAAIIVTEDGRIAAQSRNKLITPGKTTDNYGFAGWVERNKDVLIKTLGPGRHFGEWWGAGIQHGYGLSGQDAKRFSLFNAGRWSGMDLIDGQLRTVPILSTTMSFDTDWIERVMDDLQAHGSYAEPGFMKPEGIVVYHHASKISYKVTFNNPTGKWAA